MIIKRADSFFLTSLAFFWGAAGIRTAHALLIQRAQTITCCVFMLPLCALRPRLDQGAADNKSQISTTVCGKGISCLVGGENTALHCSTERGLIQLLNARRSHN
jgi:hypothetical protein